MSHTLLLADDSVTIQRVIELTFADEDVRVIAVSSGDEAIAVLNRTPPDIVLADVGMPRMNGWVLAREIKTSYPDIRVGLVTGYGETGPTDPLERSVVDFILAKPISEESLRTIVSSGV